MVTLKRRVDIKKNMPPSATICEDMPRKAKILINFASMNSKFIAI